MSDEEQEAGPVPGDWCMDCGLFPGLDGHCSKCGRDTEDFRGVKEGEYCTKCGKIETCEHLRECGCGAEEVRLTFDGCEECDLEYQKGMIFVDRLMNRLRALEENWAAREEEENDE